MKPALVSLESSRYSRVGTCDSCDSFKRHELSEKHVCDVQDAANNCDRRHAAIALAVFEGNVAKAALTLLTNDSTSPEGIRICKLWSKCECWEYDYSMCVQPKKKWPQSREKRGGEGVD